MTLGRALEGLAVALGGLALALGLIAALSGFFAGRDQAGLAIRAGGIGQSFPDLGDRQLAPGEPRPRYNSEPPTSGAHFPAAVTHDGADLSDDQILGALAEGNVIVVFGGRRAPAALVSLGRAIAGAFTPALVAAGQAVILARRTGTRGVIALAWTRLLRVVSPEDPLLRSFAERYLGHGVAGR